MEAMTPRNQDRMGHPTVGDDERIDLSAGDVARVRGQMQQADTAEAALDAVSAAQRLGEALVGGGRRQEARALYEAALGLAQERLGASHPATLTALHDLAVLCDATGDAARADRLWAEARAVLVDDSGHASTTAGGDQ
jgi:hypothetical protein